MNKKQVLQKKFNTGFLSEKIGTVCTLKECYNKKIEDLKIYGNSTQEYIPVLDNITLPNGYTRLDCINISDANALINYSATLNTSIEMELEFNSFSSTYSEWLFCCRISGDNNALDIFLNAGGYLSFDYGNIRRYGLARLSTRTRYIIRTEKNKLYLNDTLLITITGDNLSITNTTDTLLFGAYTTYNNTMTTFAYYATDAKCYSVKIWEDTTLIANLIPCIYNNVAGFYDLVAESFVGKYNGSGDFTAGNLVSNTSVDINSVGNKLIPTSYKQLNYIIANTAIVLLEHIATANTEIEIDIELTNKIDTQCLFCCRTSLDTDSLTCFVIGERIRFDYGRKKYTTIYVNTDTRYKITFKNNKLYVNNTLQATIDNENINNTKIFNLFSSYNPYGTNSNFCKNVKCYSVKCWENGNLVANYVPCLNNNNTAGFYDLITKNFYTSTNSNPLTASDLSTKELTSITVNNLRKNLCNFSNKEVTYNNGSIKLYNNCYIKYNDYYNSDAFSSSCFYLEKDKTYTISATYVSGSSSGGYSGYISVINVENNNYKIRDAIIIKSNYTNNYTKTFTCTKTGWYKLYFWHGVENSTDLIYKIQLEENNIATQAEDTSINTQVLTLKDTLKKIDNTKDILSFKNENVLRKIKKAYITTDTPATAELSLNSNELIISIDASTAFGVAIKANTTCLCNRLDSSKIIVDSNINMHFPVGIVGNTLADFRNWLANKELYIIYVREIEEIEEIEEIKLKKGINTIFIDSNVPAQITTKYRSKRKEVL